MMRERSLLMKAWPVAIELCGVDEYTDDYGVVFAARATDKRQMAVVESSHGGHEGDAAALAAALVDCLFERGDGFDNFHLK